MTFDLENDNWQGNALRILAVVEETLGAATAEEESAEEAEEAVMVENVVEDEAAKSGVGSRGGSGVGSGGNGHEDVRHKLTIKIRPSQ